MSVNGGWAGPVQSLDEKDELLLVASLGVEQAARVAFYDWSTKVDLDRSVDAGTYRLLPLLYKNLERLGVDHPLMGRLRGLYRRSWYRNHQLLVNLSQIIRDLNTSGLDTMLLGGVALAGRGYTDLGARYLDELELLVPRDQAQTAIKRMACMGWQPEAFRIEDLRYREATMFAKAEDRFRLYWTPLRMAWITDPDAFWKTATETRINRVKTQLPAAEDLLLHLTAHSDNPDRPQVCWIADAYTIVSSSTLHWPSIAARARERRLGSRIKALVHFLDGKLNASIPQNTLRDIHALAPSFTEKLERRIAQKRASGRDSALKPIIVAGAKFLRYTNGASRSRAATELPAFLKHYYESTSYLRIAARLATNGLRRVMRGLVRGLPLPLNKSNNSSDRLGHRAPH